MATREALALEAQAATELAAGRLDVAFRLADRRCRLPLPAHPHCYVLRAEALHRQGSVGWACDDIRQALRIAPDDIAANRRMMVWGTMQERAAAAATLARHDHDHAVRRQAIDHLRTRGRTALAHCQVIGRRIEGWAVWDDEHPIDVSVTDDAGTTGWRIGPDPGHPLRGTGSAASFDLPRPEARGTQTVEIAWTGGSLGAVRVAQDAVLPAGPAPFDRADHAGITVIVPVYGDAVATEACLASVLAAIENTPAHRLIVVDDASPDPAIKQVLHGLARRDRVSVLANPRNLGFVGSINRALAQAGGGDVVLLNADTLVPPRALQALAAVAASAPDIGTVTPLSNNGEFTSFPQPNTVNPLPPLADVVALDALAARCNAGLLVDLPSGIGFCLFVTRACRAAVGPLSEDYHRGYLEDADFCLRARDLGFRNVCAPSVYVGHVGGRSFAQDKRALVVRNLGVLERRFPSHRAECAAFLAADPLRNARAAIERALPARGDRPVILIAGRGPMAELAADRARRLAEAGQGAIICAVGSVGATSVAMADPAGHAPQSLAFDLSHADGEAACASAWERLAPSRVEVVDLDACPDGLLRILLRSRRPTDLWVTSPRLAALVAGVNGPPALRAARPHRPAPAETGKRARLLRSVVAQADRLIAPDRVAEACLRGRPARHAIVVLGEARVPGSAAARSGAVHLGIVPVCRSWREQVLIGAIAARLAAIRPDVPLTVVGDVADDEALMRAGHVFVTGGVEPAALARTMAAHGIGQVLLGLERPLFGHPMVRHVLQGDLPAVYLDWSAGSVRPRRGDLPVDPAWPIDRIAQRIAAWLPRTAADLRQAG